MNLTLFTIKYNLFALRIYQAEQIVYHYENTPIQI